MVQFEECVVGGRWQTVGGGGLARSGGGGGGGATEHLVVVFICHTERDEA